MSFGNKRWDAMWISMMIQRYGWQYKDEIEIDMKKDLNKFSNFNNGFFEFSTCTK